MTKAKYTNKDWIKEHGDNADGGVIAIIFMGALLVFNLGGLNGNISWWSGIEPILFLILMGVAVILAIIFAEIRFLKSAKLLTEKPKWYAVNEVKKSKLYSWLLANHGILVGMSLIYLLVRYILRNISDPEFQKYLTCSFIVIGIFIAMLIGAWAISILFKKWVDWNHERATKIYESRKKDD